MSDCVIFALGPQPDHPLRVLLGHFQEEIAGPVGSHPIERRVVGQDITHPTLELRKLQLSYSVGLVRPRLQGPGINQ